MKGSLLAVIWSLFVSLIIQYSNSDSIALPADAINIDTILSAGPLIGGTMPFPLGFNKDTSENVKMILVTEELEPA